jgi:hypothetical protein
MPMVNDSYLARYVRTKLDLPQQAIIHRVIVSQDPGSLERIELVILFKPEDYEEDSE